MPLYVARPRACASPRVARGEAREQAQDRAILPVLYAHRMPDEETGVRRATREGKDVGGLQPPTIASNLNEGCRPTPVGWDHRCGDDGVRWGPHGNAHRLLAAAERAADDCQVPPASAGRVCTHALKLTSALCALSRGQTPLAQQHAALPYGGRGGQLQARRAAGSASNGGRDRAGASGKLRITERGAPHRRARGS